MGLPLGDGGLARQISDLAAAGNLPADALTRQISELAVCGSPGDGLTRQISNLAAGGNPRPTP